MAIRWVNKVVPRHAPWSVGSCHVSFSQSFCLVLHCVSRELCNLYRCWLLMAVRCHKVTIVQSLFESEDLIREAHRSQITDLSKKYHSLTIRTSLKKVYCHHQQDTWKHVRDLSWPVHEVCKKLPALGVYNQDVFDSYPQELTTKDSTHLQSVQRACTKNRVANDTVLDLTKPQFLSNSDNKQSFVDLNLALKLANIPDHRHSSFGCSRKLEMCNRGGRRYRSYSPTTSQHEGHGAEHSPTVLPHQEVALGHRSSCCMCKIKAINETHSQFLLGVWMQHDLQDIYEGQKKFFWNPWSWHRILEVSYSVWGQSCAKTKLLLLLPHPRDLPPFMQQI